MKVAFDHTRRARTAMNPLDYASAARDYDVIGMVRAALAEGRCALAFQPVMRADGVIAFYEGLIRVLDDAGRVLPARAFMDHVAEDGIGRDLDAATLSLAFEALQRHPTLRLSVNVSARSLGDSVWRAVIDSNLGLDDFRGERLILEIGEASAMLLPEVVARFMEEMQPLGVAFALDDFGSGATSLRHLRQFFFDLVKLDRSFISGVANDPDNQVLVGALMAVAHQFDMFAVATGVEMAEDAEWLIGAGIDCLQGYHLGVPRMSLPFEP